MKSRTRQQMETRAQQDRGGVDDRLVFVKDDTSGGTLRLPRQERLACGAVATIDHDAFWPRYRCDHCGVIPGSIAMSDRCRSAMERKAARQATNPEL